MKHAWMLSVVLVAAPGWCDETAAEPASAKAAFDLTNPEIRKALHRTVATQTGQYVLAPAKDVEKDVDLEPVTVRFESPEEPVRTVEYPTSLPSPTPVSDTLFSTIVRGFIDDVLLDLAGDEYDYREHQNPTIACTARGDDIGSTICDRADATRQRTTP